MSSAAAWIPCTAHSLNLVWKNAAECCLSAVNFFDFLEKLYVFFTNSTRRHQVLTDALKASEASLTLKRHFAMFADIFNDDEPGDISTELFLYKLIIDKGTQDTFPTLRSR